MSLWEYDQLKVSEVLDINLPGWITDDNLSPADVAAIVQGGCASGAYMPAVTYYEAQQTMGDHGDDVLQYLQDELGELPQPSSDESWSGMACFYLSYAVELFAHGIEQELEEAIEEAEEMEDDAE